MMHRRKSRPDAAPPSPPEARSKKPAQPSNRQMADAAAEEYTPQSSFLYSIGEGLGFGAGVAITELLELLPSWRAPVLDERGDPVQSVSGAEREGDYDIQKRHQEVVGPQIDEYGDSLDDGWWRDLVEGVGQGATKAPGATYRHEAADKKDESGWFDW